MAFRFKTMPRAAAGFILLLSFFTISVLGLEETCVVGADGDSICTQDAAAATTTTMSSCVDTHENCDYWASIGECSINPGYMSKSCRLSCGLCSVNAAAGKVKVSGVSSSSSSSTFGVDQTIENSEYGVGKKQTQARLLEAQKYMDSLTEDVISPALKEICRNEHELCAIWAVYGECEKNPSYMKKNCGPVCHSCDYLSIETRCPVDPNAPEAWGPNDLDKMFNTLVQEPYLSQYEVQVLSSPSKNGGPWVITMENVVSEEEAKRLIELGAVEGYKRSADVGKLRPDGTFEDNINSGRTSTNAWCQHDCYEDEMAQAVIHRISNFTGINETNSEYLQLLRYEPGQYYRAHHDYIPFERTRQQGNRILTVYLYLNDVQSGGGTNFDQLGITVSPKRGRALLWPSVLNEEPHKKDDRTTHQALPVEVGVKYGANAWFHMRDFKTPNRNNCQ